jgi:hypothetical protein
LRIEPARCSTARAEFRKIIAFLPIGVGSREGISQKKAAARE